MTFWTPTNFQAITGGRWLVAPSKDHASLNGLTIDSRDVRSGGVFVAIRGERLDGHDYLADAAGRGAELLIVSDESVVKKDKAAPQAGVLLVDDTVVALQVLARAYREVLHEADVDVIAITGSNGKTTTRNLIHVCLSATLKGTQSPKSFNNHLGVPLTLLAASPDDDFVVAEVGTNHPGEIAALAEIARPNVGVVTHIGTAHIGNFESPSHLRDEKLSLLAAVKPGPGGRCAVAVGEAVDLATADWHESADVIRAVPVKQCKPTTEGSRLTTSDGLTIDLPMLGRHNVANAALAVAIGRWFGVADGDLAKALSRVAGPPMRLQVQTVGDPGRPTVVINDCYNANPDSMRQALSVLRSYPVASRRARRIAVLGDMLELGDEGPAAHRAVAMQLAAADSHDAARDAVDHAVLVGELSAHTADALSAYWPADRIHTFSQGSDALADELAALVEPGDVILLKGSRAMALEQFIPAIEKAATRGRPVALIH